MLQEYITRQVYRIYHYNYVKFEYLIKFLITCISIKKLGLHNDVKPCIACNCCIEIKFWHKERIRSYPYVASDGVERSISCLQYDTLTQGFALLMTHDSM